MELATKERMRFRLLGSPLWLALSLLLCSHASGSTASVSSWQPRAELFSKSAGLCIESSSAIPVLATGCVDGSWIVVLECSVVPKTGLLDTAFSKDARRYLNDIQQQTGMAVHSAQRARLADHLRTNSHSRLSSVAGETHRKAFSRAKDDLIMQWERQTGQAWPRYTQQVTSQRTGRVLRDVGDPFDAHHIIENVYEGPHTWWNIHPAEFPGAHQGGIHRAGGVLREIMP